MTPRSAQGRRRLAVLAFCSALVPALTGCGSAPGTSDPQGVDQLTIPTPSPDPVDFVAGIDNPYLPLTPGSEWTYEATSSEGDETITVSVTEETRVVAGVNTTVVRDVVTDADGQVVEETDDWFAQDTAGNVWYFGEATTAYGSDASTEGSWEAGVDGAQAGIAMLATPRVGDGYRMEFREGVAEDLGEVVAVAAEITLDTESFDGVVKTADTTPLEPGLVEAKYYAPGIGLVFEETVAGGDHEAVLVEHRTG